MPVFFNEKYEIESVCFQFKMENNQDFVKEELEETVEETVTYFFPIKEEEQSAR